MSITSALVAISLLLAAAAGAYVCARRGRTLYALALLAGGPVLAVMPSLVTSSRPASMTPASQSPAAAAPDSGAPPAAVQAIAAAPSGGTSIAPMSGARPGEAADRQEREAAEQLRVAGKFAEARDAYRKLAARRPQDADAWADAADCAAAAAAGNLEAGASDIEHALSAQPRHPKALWLKASLELQHKRYTAAATLWAQLLSVLPDDSEDKRIVQANLQEAKALAGKPAGAGF